MTAPPRRRWIAWIPALAWAGCIFALSAQSTLPGTGGVTDKQAHAMAYGVLAMLSLMAAAGWRWRAVTASRVLLAFTVAVLYGVSDEVHQAFVPGRTPDVADVVADATGAGLAVLAGWAWAILLGGRSTIQRS